MVKPDLARRSEALVGVGGRHPDIEDGDVGLEVLHQADGPVAVSRGAHHLESRLLQEPGEALAQQNGVVS